MSAPKQFRFRFVFITFLQMGLVSVSTIGKQAFFPVRTDLELVASSLTWQDRPARVVKKKNEFFKCRHTYRQLNKFGFTSILFVFWGCMIQMVKTALCVTQTDVCVTAERETDRRISTVPFRRRPRLSTDKLT